MSRIAPDAPFCDPIAGREVPRAMREAPVLPSVRAGTLQAHSAVLINPFYPKDAHASFGKHVLTPTLALTSFAATTPGHWQLRYHDENLLQGPPPSEPLPAVVGITVHLTFAERAFALARWYRALGSKVVLGGLHVLSCPDECAPHADALALGDGVQLWPRILADMEQGKLAQRYEATFQSSYRDEPAPRRDLLPRASFLTTSSINATRGCHNRCEFCYLSTDGLRMPYRMRDPEQVVRELDADDQPYAVFTDNNLGSNREYLRTLSRALGRREKIWSAAVSIDVSDDPTLVRDMALGGCVGVFIGFESLDNDNLSEARKRTPRTQDYARRVRLFHEHGIQVNGSFVLGFDNDRKHAFAQLAEWVEDARLESATFHILTPYPGTPLFRKLVAEQRILHRDWSRYDTAHAVFRPKHMRPDELERGYAWLYQRIFSHASIWARRPSDVRAVPAYLAMSYLYKRNNAMWRFLIERNLTHRVWRPLVEWSAMRHRGVRERIRARSVHALPKAVRALNVVYPSV